MLLWYSEETRHKVIKSAAAVDYTRKFAVMKYSVYSYFSGSDTVSTVKRKKKNVTELNYMLKM